MSDLINIEIVGTSHIAPESKKRILQKFNETKPDIICVELDRARLIGMRDKNKKKIGLSAIKQIGVTGYIFAIIGSYVQKKLGKMTGMMPGDEMLLGVTLAEKNNLKLELIDQDIRITLKKINKIPLREKLRIISDIIRAPFQRKNKTTINLSKIPEEELVKTLIAQLQNRYPYIYKTMIDDRDKIMAKRIFTIRYNNPTLRILAIVGEGHKEGMIKQIKQLEADNLSFMKQ